MEKTLEFTLGLSVLIARAVHSDALAVASHRELWAELTRLQKQIRAATALCDAKGLADAQEAIWAAIGLYALTVEPPRSDAEAEARIAIVELGLQLWRWSGEWITTTPRTTDTTLDAFRDWREPTVASRYDPEPEDVG